MTTVEGGELHTGVTVSDYPPVQVTPGGNLKLDMYNPFISGATNEK